jgi:biotin carboxyl carrier protein
MASSLLHYVVEFDNGSRFDVHIDPDDPTNIAVDGVDSEVEVTSGPQGLFVSSSHGQRIPLNLRYENGELVAETADGKCHRARVELAESREWRETVENQPAPPPLEHSGRIEAPIAGNIVSILAAEGTAVLAGSPVILLEAMKMQNTIFAPITGAIHFEVSAGQVVRSGDLLATIKTTGTAQ